MLLAVGSCGWIVGFGLRGDDFLHLYHLASKGPVVFVLTPFGGHALAVTKVVYALSAGAFGLYTEAYMVTVLLTHLLNVLLCQRLGTRLGGDPYAASAAAALWGATPSAIGTLGWYSVFGQVMATTVMGVTLLLIVRHLDSTPVLTPRPLLGWLALSWIGALCFGTGLAFALVLPAMIAIVSPRSLRHASTAMLLVLAPVAAAGVYAGYLVVAAQASHFDPSAVHWSIAFATLWRQNAALWSQLVLQGSTELLSGQFLAGPAREVQVALAIGLLVALVAVATRHTARWAVALTLCALAVYAMIAIGRGWMPSITAVPRYHYQAQFALALVVALVLAGLCARLAERWRRRLVLVWIAALAIAVAHRGPLPRPEGAVTTSELLAFRETIATAVRATPPGGMAFLRNGHVDHGRYIIRLVSPEFPGLAAWFCILFPENTMERRTVRIVEPDPTVRAAAAGSRTAELLIAAAPMGVPVRRP